MPAKSKHSTRVAKYNSTLSWAKWATAAAAGPIFGLGLERVAKWPLPWPIPAADLVLFLSGSVAALCLFGVSRLFARMHVSLPGLPPDWTVSPQHDEDIVFRQGQEKRLLQDLTGRRPAGTINIITGASGAGKSTIVEKRVRLQIEGQNDQKDGYVRISDYRDLLGSPRDWSGGAPVSRIDQVIAALLRRSPNGRTYVFLDQFETELFLIKSDAERKSFYTGFLQEAAKHERLIVSIMVRKEWLFDALDFLTEIEVRSHIVSFAIDQNDTDRWMVKFSARLGGDEASARKLVAALGDRPAGFLAVEARMVDVVLADPDQSFEERRTIIRQQGVDGLIGRFFQRILDSSPEIARESLVAAKILTALVPETPGLRLPKTIEELSTIVHEEEAIVEEVCDYLITRGMLAATDHDTHQTYRVVHDYIADYITRASDVPLDPADRDNLVTFRTRAARDHRLETFTRFVPPRQVTFERVTIALFGVACLLAVPLSWWFRDAFVARSFDAYQAIRAQTSLWDTSYTYVVALWTGRDPLWYALGDNAVSYHAILTLAFGAVLIVFMIYCDIMVRNLTHVSGKRGIVDRLLLRRGTWQKHFMAWSVLLALYAVVAKPFLIFWTGYAGLGVALCYYLMGTETGLSKQSRSAFLPTSKLIAFNLGMSGLVLTPGIMTWQYFCIFEWNTPHLAVFGYITVAMFLLAIAIVGLRWQCGSEVLSRRRSFYDRLTPVQVAKQVTAPG
jgi:hypothetical protein